MAGDGGVFCDYLQVTVPVGEWDGLRADLSPVLDEIGASVDVDDVRAGGVLWRVDGGGTVKARQVGAVAALGISGSAIAGLRLLGLLGSYLARVGAVPHRVTRLDASLDVVEETSPVISRLAAAVVSPDGLALSRKRVAPKHCTRYVSRTPEGIDTGTIYVGSAQADVRLCVYDKRVERLARDDADPGPLTRYELRLRSGTGVTLRDAALPGPVFWHYAAPAVLRRPSGVAGWVPHGEGFSLDAARPALPAQRLLRRVETSPEVAALLRLADEVGPHGFDFLVSALRRVHSQGGRGLGLESPPALSGAAVGPVAAVGR